MARTRETSIVESEMTEGETAGNVIGRGFSVLVQHNAQLMDSSAKKDAILMQFVAQAQTERSQFWDAQAQMIGKFSELLDNIQKLKDREADRQERRDEAKASRDMKGRVYDDARQLIHIGANQFFKRPMLSESEKGLVATFIESITPEQLEKLQETFRPPQMIAFSNIVNALVEAEAKEKTTEKDKPKTEDTDDAVH